MSETREERRFPIALMFVGVLLALLVLYPLSVGPAAFFLAWHGEAPPSVVTGLQAFYFPLEWFADRSDVMASFVEWYSNLWLELAPPIMD